MAYFITGDYPPNNKIVGWTLSSHVDVVIVDVLQDRRTEISHVQDLDSLQQAAVTTLPNNVALRLFLVEDMTGPIVEILGRTYSCHPHFFAAHMESQYYSGFSSIDKNGAAGAKNTDKDVIYVPKSLTDIQSRPFLSISYTKAFNRLLEKHEKPRMCRPCDFSWLGGCEERLSACFYELDDRDARVGNLFSTPFSLRFNF